MRDQWLKGSLKQRSMYKEDGKGKAWISEFNQLLSLGRQLTRHWKNDKKYITEPSSLGQDVRFEREETIKNNSKDLKS